MNRVNELNWNELNHSYQPSDFSFRTTEEVDSNSELLDQEECLAAIRRGLSIESEGYNLYISGVVNQKVEMAIRHEVEKQASLREESKIWGYIYNFSEPEEPKAIQLEREDALALKLDLQELRAFLANDISLLLEQEEVKEKQEMLLKEFEKISEKYALAIEEKADQYHIIVRKTAEGIRFAPLGENGEGMTKEVFLNLSDSQQAKILENISKLQEYTDEIMQQLEKKEQTYLKLYEEVGQEVILREIGKLVKRLKEKYQAYDILQDYFNAMAEELLDHLELLVECNTDEQKNSAEKTKEVAIYTHQEVERMLRNYDINLLGNPTHRGVPVIVDRDYPQLNLLGKILLDTENNMFYSDFMHIRPGLCHYANGGYLILHLQDLLERNGWQSLRSMLQTGKLSIEGNEEIGIALNKSQKPEPIDQDVKVIILGSQELYELLRQYDEETMKWIKVNVHFDEEINMTQKNIEKLASLVKYHLHEEGIKPVSIEAFLKVIEYGHRQLEHPSKMTSDIEWMMDFFREAQEMQKTQIEVEDIERCIKEREKIERKLKEQMDESLEDGTFLIDTKGGRVGQINGLAVYAIGKLSFGRPVRITATTYRGKEGIIDIENEARLSGSIHTKGVHIITGFLGNEFAQERPLSLNCNLCFEQSYAGIDGDSASSAELYAILSSLAELPIAQNLAVTGSVNQFGEIQPVGGINEKIEGFFQLCHQRGLTGNEGVMIPRKNMKELMLSDGVIKSVQNGQFHIYAITDICQGVEIVMGQSKEVVRKRVEEKLTRFNK